MDTVELQKHIKTMPVRRLKELEAVIEERDGVNQLIGNNVNKRLLELTRYFISLRRVELDKLDPPDKRRLMAHSTSTTANWGKAGSNGKLRVRRVMPNQMRTLW